MKILFIGHDASRTGAPILLLNLMKWMKINTDISFDILLLDGGELEEEYKEVSRVYFNKPNSIKRLSYSRRLINKVLKIDYKPFEKYKSDLFNKLKSNNYDLIYGNTIVSSTSIVELMSFLPSVRSILHVHELNDLTSNYENEIAKLKSKNIHFITVSNLTKMNLIDNHSVSELLISLVYEYIDTKKVLEFKQTQKNNKFIINGSGLVQIRKGYDIFLSISKRAKTKYPDIPFHFIWIGYIPPHLEYYLKNDIAQSDLCDYIDFVGVFENPYPAFSESSVFLMTSRQDPFPLVCLEHALLEKPIICFDKGTGISEFVEDNAGKVVPYFDIEAVVDSLEFYYSNPTLCTLTGKIAGEKALNYDINIQAKKIVDLITVVSNYNNTAINTHA